MVLRVVQLSIGKQSRLVVDQISFFRELSQLLADRIVGRLLLFVLGRYCRIQILQQVLQHVVVDLADKLLHALVRPPAENLIANFGAELVVQFSGLEREVGSLGGFPLVGQRLTTDRLTCPRSRGRRRARRRRRVAFVGRLFISRLFIGRLFIGRLFIGRLFVGRLFVGRLFVGRLFVSRLFVVARRFGVVKKRHELQSGFAAERRFALIFGGRRFFVGGAFGVGTGGRRFRFLGRFLRRRVRGGRFRVLVGTIRLRFGLRRIFGVLRFGVFRSLEDAESSEF